MIEQVYPGDLASWIEKMKPHGEPVLLDVREPREVEVARIQPEGCTVLHIPMGVIPPRLQELDPKRPVACLCHHGGRSMRVAAFLEYQGFAHVANVVGGINAWSSQVDSSVPRY